MLVVFWIVVSAAVDAGGVMELSVTDAAEPVAGVTECRRLEQEAHPGAADDLPYMPGWPVKVTSGMFSPSRGIALADFDGDGRQELIMPTSGRQVHVWTYEALPYPGWPVSIDSMGQYAASVADVDLDGDYEVAVGTRGWTQGGQVYLFGEDGSSEPGWPFRGPHGGNFNEAPTLADIDGDDTLELIVGERDWPIGHVHVLRHDGTEYSANWPQEIDHVPATGAAVADINLDGVTDIVFCSYNSMYVFQPDGSVLPGWPRQVANANFSYQSPALADVDGDDTLEIVTAMHKDAAGCYVFRHDGTLLWYSGFPRWTYCPPTAADLYRDNDLKVLCGLSGVIAGGASVLYGYDGSGSVLAGFPYYQSNGGAAEGNITVADLDGDADMEVIFTSNLMATADSAGYLYAIHHDGSLVSGWPLRPFGFTYLNGATVADVDGDDSLDIIAVSEYDGELQVSVWEAGVPFDRTSWEWPTYQFDMARTGEYRSMTSGVTGPAVTRRPGVGFRLVPSIARPGRTLVLRPDRTCCGTVTLYRRSGSAAAVLAAGTVAPGTRVELPVDLAAGVYFVRLDAGVDAGQAKLVVR